MATSVPPVVFPPPTIPLTAFEEAVGAAQTLSKSPKSAPLPVEDMVIYSVSFVFPPAYPPAIIPRV